MKGKKRVPGKTLFFGGVGGSVLAAGRKKMGEKKSSLEAINQEIKGRKKGVMKGQAFRGNGVGRGTIVVCGRESLLGEDTAQGKLLRIKKKR